MHYVIFRTFLAVLFGLVLTATGLWAAGAEEEPAAAADKKYVTDPTTGKVVTAPEYGGTLTVSYVLIGETTDPFITGAYAGFLIDGVNERLAVGDWGLDRKELGVGLELSDWRGSNVAPGHIRRSTVTICHAQCGSAPSTGTAALPVVKLVMVS